MYIKTKFCSKPVQVLQCVCGISHFIGSFYEFGIVETTTNLLIRFFIPEEVTKHLTFTTPNIS